MGGTAATIHSGSAWHEARDSAMTIKDRHADRRAALWVQMLRIEKYLPELYRQREEATSRLEALAELIRDEQEAARGIRDRFN